MNFTNIKTIFLFILFSQITLSSEESNTLPPSFKNELRNTILVQAKAISQADKDPVSPDTPPWIYGFIDLFRNSPPDSANGIPGQNKETPGVKDFYLHYIVNVGDYYYDPSYGRIFYELTHTIGREDSVEKIFTEKCIDAWYKGDVPNYEYAKRSHPSLADKYLRFTLDTNWNE